MTPSRFPLLMPCDTAEWLDYIVEADDRKRHAFASPINPEQSR